MTKITETMVKAYATPVPRYTSYPTAPHFHDGVRTDKVSSWMAALPETEAISLYLHIPFCDRMCWFCGCHTQHVERYDPVSFYLKSLYKEIALVSERIGRRQKVARIHLGGGSPSIHRSNWRAEISMSARGAMFVIRKWCVRFETKWSDMVIIHWPLSPCMTNPFNGALNERVLTLLVSAGNILTNGKTYICKTRALSYLSPLCRLTSFWPSVNSRFRK